MLGRYRETVRTWSDPAGRALLAVRLRPNHLTLMGLGVSLLAAAAFIAGRTRWAGVLLIVAGLFDLLDGSLARASGQVTPFGAFLDSVIDRYSDLVVLLGIVVLFARTPNERGALVAMAGLVGSVMVSYTKARAESIGVPCTIGFMERPERMLCLIVGALTDLLEPALWVLAVLANVTAVQRILFTRRSTRDVEIFRAVILAVCLAATPAASQPASDLPPSLPGASAAPSESERSPSTPTTPETPGAPLAPSPAPPAASTPPTAGSAAVTPPVATSKPVRGGGPPPDVERAWAQAVAEHQQGGSAALVREFSAPAALDSPVADHLRWVLADALERVGNVSGARAMAASIAERHPDSRLAPRALILTATLASKEGDEAAAQAALKRLIESYPDAAELSEALYLLGMSAEARGQLEPAAQAYRQVMLLAPTSGYSSGASARLAVLTAAGTRLPDLTMPQRVDRAERLLRGGVPAAASEEAERIAKEARDPGLVVRALRVVADGAARLGRYDAAAKAIDLAIPHAPPDLRARLRLEQARFLSRTSQKERALILYSTVSGAAAEAEASEALYQRARLLDDLDRPSEAEGVYRTVAQRYPAREVAGASLWRLGWLAYLKGDVRGAEQRWSRMLTSPGGRSFRLGGLYWKGRAVEQLGRRGAANALFREVLAEAPRSYYGLLAGQRVPAPDPARVTVSLPADPAEVLARDPGWARVDLLRRVGLVEEAWLELEDVVQRSVGDSARLYGFSSAYVQSERYHLALRILRRHFGALAASGDPALPRAFWEMLYPIGWRPEMTEAATRAGLDPFFVAAVVREESSYYPRAVSRAGARGLMQLMPATAQPMAEQSGMPFGGGDLLDDPRANLQLGTSFLASLMREFGDPRLALAAYNAGPRRARQWWQASKTSDLEAFVEQIPFDETRGYVKRVMLSWDEYRRLYATQ
jgi:soluble lytic murein transglycosylase